MQQTCIYLQKPVVSIMFDFRNYKEYNFMSADTESISFSFQSDDPYSVFKVRQIIGHIVNINIT